MPNDYRFAWPASAIRRGQEMTLLYQARESSPDRTPITQLIAHAIRTTYGHQAGPRPITQHSKKEDHDQTQNQTPAPRGIFPETPAA